MKKTTQSRSEKKRFEPKRLLLLTLAIAATIFVALAFAACGGANNDGNNQVDGIDEPDIVKVTDDGYIIKLQRDGLSVSKLSQSGVFEPVYSEPRDSQVPISLITYNDILISVATTTQNVQRISFYDMTAFHSGGQIEVLRTTEIFGNYYTCRISDGVLYFVSIANINSVYQEYNYETGKYESVQVTPEINDSVENKKPYKVLGERHKDDYDAVFMARLELDDLLSSSYTLSAFYDKSVNDMYMAKDGIYFISLSLIYGCNYHNTENGTYMTVINTSDLSMRGKIVLEGQRVLSRHAICSKDGYLFVVSTDLQRSENGAGTQLTVFDGALREVASLGGIAPGETVKSVLYDDEYCYIVTFLQVDPLFKIDIRDPLKPVLTGSLKIDGYSSMLVDFREYKIGVGFENQYVKVTLFDVSGDAPKERNSIILEEYYAEATYNMKALLIKPELNMFGFTAGEYAYVFGLGDDGETLEIKARLNEFTVPELPMYGVDRYPRRMAAVNGYLLVMSDYFNVSYSLSSYSLIDILDTSIERADSSTEPEVPMTD